jgi:hypothetical protein
MVRHVYIVFLPNPPIAISSLPYFSSHGKSDFPKTLLLVSWAKIQYARDGEGSFVTVKAARIPVNRREWLKICTFGQEKEKAEG